MSHINEDFQASDDEEAQTKPQTITTTSTTSNQTGSKSRIAELRAQAARIRGQTDRIVRENSFQATKYDLDKAERHARGDWSPSQPSETNLNIPVTAEIDLTQNNNDSQSDSNNNNNNINNRYTPRGSRARGRAARRRGRGRGSALTTRNLYLHDSAQISNENESNILINKIGNENDKNETSKDNNNNNNNANVIGNENGNANGNENENKNDGAADGNNVDNEGNEIGDENDEAKEFPTIEEQKELDKKSIFIKNLPLRVAVDELNEYFSACGTIQRITIVSDKYTGAPTGCGYIQFKNQESVQEALLLDGRPFKGQNLGIQQKRTNLPWHMREENQVLDENGNPVAVRGRGRGRSRGRARGRGRGAARGGGYYGPYRGRGRGRARGSYFNPYGAEQFLFFPSFPSAPYYGRGGYY